jgi:DNA-binding winged helix-turn-helix (wHTH) protein
VRSGELHKQGRKIRLEGQPVQVLIKLLEHPGELVTREACVTNSGPPIHL